MGFLYCKQLYCYKSFWDLNEWYIFKMGGGAQKIIWNLGNNSLNPISHFRSVCSRQTRQHSTDCAQAQRKKTTAFDNGSSGPECNTDAESSAKPQTMICLRKTVHFFLSFPLLRCPWWAPGTFLELCPRSLAASRQLPRMLGHCL